MAQEPFGESGEVGTTANAIEVGKQMTVGAINGVTVAVAEDPAGLQGDQMTEELLAIEVRQGPSLVRIDEIQALPPPQEPVSKIVREKASVKRDRVFTG
jgi:hypothetical protein